MEPREFTFGDETEDETRTKQERGIRTIVRSLFGAHTGSAINGVKRLDPRSFIDEARVMFLERARRSGLNPHEALHAWVDGVDVEAAATGLVLSEDYCRYEIADRLGITVEELDRQREQSRGQAAQSILNGITKMLRGSQKPETLN
jgi:hypothetical protein